MTFAAGVMMWCARACVHGVI